MKNKVVYVLGAGFSLDAGAPSQEKLIQKIFEVHQKRPHVLGQRLMGEFQSFLNDELNISGKLQETIPLEDIFTPIDRCIIDDVSFRGVSTRDLKKKRDLIYQLISKTLQHLLENSNKHYIDLFAQYLIHCCKVRAKGNYSKQDPVAVISTNWDILLDNSIHDRISGYEAVVDYCCHISSYDKWDERIKPGLEILGQGGFNIKLLKLHGSLNWLQCPRCLRLYVKFHEKIAVEDFSKSGLTCRHCNNNFGKHNSHKLISNLIMPTFIKNLTNAQYKVIWQNAGIELSEANRIVFIGYSLPQADFEMRQLLSRMVRKNAAIEVIDFKSEHDKGRNYEAVINRYKQFFGREITGYEHGAKRFVEEKIVPLLRES